MYILFIYIDFIELGYVGYLNLLVCLLFGVLWHIKHCWLFNVKSILFKYTVLFQTIQFSKVHCLIVQKISIPSYTVYWNSFI